MSPTTPLLRRSLSGAGYLASGELRRALAADPRRIARGARVDPHWRRLDAGGAARLTPQELIDPGRRVGRWHGVDPRRPHDGWRSVWKLLGLLGWAGAVGGAWWLGSSKGRGPLAAVAELDRLGEAVGAALDGFDALDGADVAP
ncbi:MAG: hypothetical protein ACLFUG_05365 [Nitriliruptoraceae bacterium]